MDGSQFDALTQRLTSIRLTRGNALRGMMAGALTLAGTARVAGEASAGKKGKKAKKGSVCHCGESAGAVCSTEKVKKKSRKMHLTSHQCDYMGACRSDINACAAAPIIITDDRLGQQCSNSDACGNNSGLRCVGGLCVPLDFGDSCTNNGECSTGNCENGACALCSALKICGSGTTAQCCTVSAECDQAEDVCVL